ncbi:SctD/MshK family protein, partial [Plastoroseomonas hellenica]
EAGLPLTARAEGGAVLVAGALPTGEDRRWAALRAWYDGAHGAGPALLVRLGAAVPAELPRLAVRAVSLAPIPFVIAADGERYGEGAVLPGGWVLDGITAEHLVFRRGDRTVTTGL